MHYYIAQWVEQSDDAGLVFRPPMDAAGDWSVIDLRPDPSIVDGYCLIGSDHVHPAAPGLWYLTDDLDANLSPPIKNYIQNGLGITLAQPTLRGAIAEIMLIHARLDGTRWKPVLPDRRGLIKIHLRGLVYAAPEILGAAYTESFDTADSDTLGPDLTWTEVQGDWDIVSNAAELGALANVSYARSSSAAAGDDQYAFEDIISLAQPGSGAQNQAMILARFAAAANSSYGFYVAEDSDGDVYKLRKTTAGVRSDLTSDTGTTLPGTPFEIMLTIEGTTLRGFIDRAQVDTVTDSSFSGSSYRQGGMYGYTASPGTPALQRVDNFGFGDFSELDQTITPGVANQAAAAYSPVVTLSAVDQYLTPAVANQAAAAYNPELFHKAILTPSGDGTNTGMFNEVGATSGLYASIDEWPRVLADWITSGEADAQAFFSLSGIKADFLAAKQVSIEINVDNSDFDTDSCTVYAQLYDADEVTAWSVGELTLGDETDSDATRTLTFTLNATALAASKAEWEAGLLRMRMDYVA